MELYLQIGLFCITWLFCLQCISGETSAGGPGSKWTCVCASGPSGVMDISPASNCSASCECIPDWTVRPDGGGWNCSCSSQGLPQSPGSIHDANCFTSCNCTSGSGETSVATKKWFSSKGAVIVLLVCVVLTTIAFLSTLACYFYHKDKNSVQRALYSSEKDSSWNSSANLICHQSGSFPEFQIKMSHFSPITGFIRKLSSILKSERGGYPWMIIQFSYVDLEQATNKFSNVNLIGLGGSSDVYRGQLKDGRVVAIKKLKRLGGPEADSEFLTEIELLSRLNHCHVVPLLGYCLESQGRQSERLLVFEYMCNGNLRDCLDVTQGKETMDWEKRVSIALGVARGLEYLHEAAAPRILHRDIKSTNILLDENYRAKITDLGMAKRLLADDLTSCNSSPARMLGTFGYFAPEYAMVGKASLKSDVFSFGVVVLELITGRQPIHKSSNKNDESLVIWAMARLRDSKLVISELPDPLLKGNFPEEEMQIMVHLARECLQWDPESRPTMSEVVQILSTIAPDKSKRRNFSASILAGNSSYSIRSTNEKDRSEVEAGRRALPQVPLERWLARSSLPLAVDRNLCQDPRNDAETIISTEYMEKLSLLMSRGRSWRSSDEETVDLTEPRFESFTQTNIHSL